MGREKGSKGKGKMLEGKGQSTGGRSETGTVERMEMNPSQKLMVHNI